MIMIADDKNITAGDGQGLTCAWSIGHVKLESKIPEKDGRKGYH